MTSSGPRKMQDISQILADLKTDYLKNFPEKIVRLKALTEAKNWDELSGEYHKLKGTGKTYGYPEISQVCEKLEWFFEELAGGRPPLYFKPEESLLFVNLIEELYQSYRDKKDIDMQSHPVAQRILAMPPRK